MVPPAFQSVRSRGGAGTIYCSSSFFPLHRWVVSVDVRSGCSSTHQRALHILSLPAVKWQPLLPHCAGRLALWSIGSRTAPGTVSLAPVAPSPRCVHPACDANVQVKEHTSSVSARRAQISSALAGGTDELQGGYFFFFFCLPGLVLSEIIQQ